MKALSVEEVKKYQLNILIEVDKFCRENNIRYYLSYGTLLGAVRHKGYIPWDDDIDIMMFREDYERFVKEFNKGRTDTLRALSIESDDNFPYEICKVHDENTKLVEDIDIVYNMGINIDVFALDNIGDDQKNADRLARKLKNVSIVMKAKNIKKRKDRSFSKKVTLAFCKMYAKLFSIRYCIKKIIRVSTTYRDQEPGKYVADICQRWYEKGQEILERSWLENTVELEFEGYKFIAPENYDEVLTVWYGDYMQLPPVEAQATHHKYKAYVL